MAINRNILTFALTALAMLSNSTVAADATRGVGFSSPAACNMPSQDVALTGKACDGYSFNSVQISCLQPADVQGKLRLKNVSNRQRSSDLFSWQTFVAINWPAASGVRGKPAVNLPLNAERRRVWETWKETDEIFLASGQRPGGWNNVGPAVVPRGCSAEASQKILHRNNKVSGALDLNDDLQPTLADGALPGTLTGQNGKVARYEIRYNKVAFDYIASNRLYNRADQNLVGEVTFPDGSILVKAAWLPLKSTERAKHFQTTKACVCQPRKEESEPLTGCGEEIVGLVGFHVMEKTQSAPQWIWSTFEQVDNVVSTSGIAASFNNKNCVAGSVSCAINKQTEIGDPNQIVRSIPIPDSQSCDAGPTDNVALLNHEMQAAIAKHSSPLQYYQLVNSQWPNPPAKGSPVEPKTVFNPVPSLFGNTTLESFVQPTSSCMGCHAMARTTRQESFVSADFTFTLDNAAHKVNGHEIENRTLLDAPTKITADKEVLAGFSLMNNTYELLPNYINSKLHCSSCHLDAGRDPNAAWLADMEKVYEVVVDKERPSKAVIRYPESLYQRINGCMTRSMNGRPLCNSKESCGTKGSPMQSLVKYMSWLTKQREKQFDSASPQGFPQLLVAQHEDENKVAIRGEQTYQQKCAFCHGADGQGRYESDRYYRPALWGPHSYNACAGMARTPPKNGVISKNYKGTHLAGFIKANMPRHSGGVLTDQEAWDLATYINRQCRPGSANKECLETLVSDKPAIGACVKGVQITQSQDFILPIAD